VPDERGLLCLDVQARLRVRAGVVHPVVGHREGSHARQPQPVAVVQGPVGVDQFPLEDVPSVLPVLPQLTTGQEAGDCMPAEVVHPTRLLQLAHHRVDVREAGHPLLPSAHELLVMLPPLYRLAVRVAHVIVPVIDGPR